MKSKPSSWLGWRTSSINYLLVLVGACLLAGGCATPQQTAALAIGGVIAAGARTPSHEIEEVYYLGVFDPEEQVPPTIYRVRVHGQSSLLNQTKFASGWAPAALIDSLGSQVSVDMGANTAPQIAAAANGQEADLEVGRRLMLFGPEGFREAPSNQRLVIVLGADPSKFFNAVDQTLGNTASQQGANSATTQQNNGSVQTSLLGAYQSLLVSLDTLNDLKLEEVRELPKTDN
jgi:hypothetical protein